MRVLQERSEGQGSDLLLQDGQAGVTLCLAFFVAGPGVGQPKSRWAHSPGAWPLGQFWGL